MVKFDLEDKNPRCSGCSILSQSKPEHTILDYVGKDQVDVLFLSDSFRYGFDGTMQIFSDKELDLIIDIIPKHIKWDVSPAVKCPSVKEKDMKTTDLHICRTFIVDTIKQYRPKLVFACGNLALKMITKKSGILDKRGRAYTQDIDGFETVVIPIYHPYTVVLEPKYKYLFHLDIKNGIDKVILNKKDAGSFKYQIIDSIETLKSLEKEILAAPVKSIDIETTGLDFRLDSIHTIAVTYDVDKDTLVFPIDHKDSPILYSGREYILEFLKVMCSDNSIKVLQNCKFDYKFLKMYGIELNNMWDTKIMAHLIDENTPKSLKDLVKEHFPLELEIL